jgi:hypothetical protein
MLNELKQKEGELDYLLSMKATDIWNNDLEIFLAEWEVSALFQHTRQWGLTVHLFIRPCSKVTLKHRSE